MNQLQAAEVVEESVDLKSTKSETLVLALWVRVGCACRLPAMQTAPHQRARIESRLAIVASSTNQSLSLMPAHQHVSVSCVHVDACPRSHVITDAGFPSVGKSTLMTKLTGTESEAAAYEFTTLTAVPGITRYQGARIQMLDLPGIIEGAADGKGRGRQVISTARTSDLILIVLDVLKPITHKLLIEKELEGFGMRLNKTPPRLTFKRKERGGISFVSHVQNPRLTRDECIAVRLWKPQPHRRPLLPHSAFPPVSKPTGVPAPALLADLPLQ